MMESTKYQAICSCGYKGRAFLNGNDALVAMERHLDKVINREGTIHDRHGRKHITDITEVK